MKLASRLQNIAPFYAMEMAKAAGEVSRSAACDPSRGGRPMLNLNLGEPDFTAIPAVQAAASEAIARGRTQYTHATGLPALREAISGWYATRWGLNIDPSRIIITAGASAALQLATLALVDVGDEVLMPDPSYPCNRHFVAAAGGRPVMRPSTAEQRFQLDAQDVAQAWTSSTVGVLLASPSNPTGTSIAPEQMQRLVHTVRERGGFTLVDELYLGLCFEEAYAHSALQWGDDLISVNSFSKYFNMTGWRLGWLVVPPALVASIEKLTQNLYICASSIAQHAALACFTPESLTEFEARRQSFRERRDFVVPALRSLGLDAPVAPDGAFYVWADCSAHGGSSWDLCHELMRRAQVALTPGRDFSVHEGERWLRLSYAASLPTLQEAMQRLREAL